MKKVGKSSKKGFTLVELIVVLVILAILAAMLVPALVGYIDRAKKEKDFQAASTVYAASQALATEAYGKDMTSDQAKTYAADKDKIKELTGITLDANPTIDFVGASGIDGFTISKYKVTISGHDYYYTLNAATWATDTYPTVASNTQSGNNQGN